MSQFLARRTMLGGVKAFTTSVLPVAAGYAMAGASGGAAGTLLGILVARKLGYVLASPMALDAATKAMKAAATESLNPLKVPKLVPSLTGIKTVKGALPISERYALEAIETLYKEFPELPGELDNEFNAIQKRVSDNEPTAQEFYLKSQQSLDDIGTMQAVDQYLKQRYDNKGLVRPDIFGSKDQPAPANIDPSAVEPTQQEETPVLPEPITTEATPTRGIDQNSRLALLDDDPLGKAIAARGIS